MLANENIIRRKIRRVLLKEYVEKLLLEAENDRLFPGAFEDQGQEFSEKVRKEFVKNKKIRKIASDTSTDSKKKKEEILAIIHKKFKSEFNRTGQPTKYRRHSNFIKYVEKYIEIAKATKQLSASAPLTKKTEEEAHKAMQDYAESERNKRLGRGKKEPEKKDNKKKDNKKKEPEKKESESGTKKIESDELKSKRSEAMKDLGGSGATKGNPLIGEIQQILKDLEYTDYQGKELKVDKSWGKRSRSAISKFLYNHMDILQKMFGKTIPDFRTKELEAGITGSGRGSWKAIVRVLTDEKLSFLAAVMILREFKPSNPDSQQVIKEKEGPSIKIKRKASKPTKGKPESVKKKIKRKGSDGQSSESFKTSTGEEASRTTDKDGNVSYEDEFGNIVTKETDPEGFEALEQDYDNYLESEQRKRDKEEYDKTVAANEKEFDLGTSEQAKYANFYKNETGSKQVNILNLNMDAITGLGFWRELVRGGGEKTNSMSLSEFVKAKIEVTGDAGKVVVKKASSTILKVSGVKSGRLLFGGYPIGLGVPGSSEHKRMNGPRRGYDCPLILEFPSGANSLIVNGENYDANRIKIDGLVWSGQKEKQVIIAKEDLKILGDGQP